MFLVFPKVLSRTLKTIETKLLNPAERPLLTLILCFAEFNLNISPYSTSGYIDLCVYIDVY